MSTSAYGNPSPRWSALTCPRARSHSVQPCAGWGVTARVLGIEPARHGRFRDTLHREPVRGQPHRRLAILDGRARLVERAGDDVVQAAIDLVFLPEVLLQPLHPLEVRDDDATGVREDVRQ